MKPANITSAPPRPAGRPVVDVLLIASVLIVAAAWRLMGIRAPQVWHDEACTIWYTRATWSDLLFRLPWSDNHSPLSFALFKLWGLAATSEVALRLQSVLFGVATVAFIVAWVRMIEPRAAWFAGLFAALSPMLVHYSQELRMYPLMILCSAAGFFFAERSVHGGRRMRNTLMMTLCGVVAGNLHAVGMAVFPMLVSYWLVRHRGLGVSWRGAIAVGAVWLVCVLPMMWLSVHWSGMGRQYGWWIASPGTRTFEAVGGPILGLDLIHRWEGPSIEPDKMWWAFAGERVLLLFPALLLGFAMLRQSVRGAAAAMLVASCVYLAILAFTSRLAFPVLIARTALPALIPLLAAAGLSLGRGRRGAAVGVLALGLTWVAALGTLWVWAVYRGPERRGVDYAVCDYIRRSIGPDDVIVCAPYWVEYSVAHHLRDVIRGEQLVVSCYPMLHGNPVRLTLGNRLEDPHWRERLTHALRPTSREAGSGHPAREMNVWLVEYGLFGVSTPEGIPYTAEITSHGFRARANQVFGDSRPLVVTRYVPDGGATRPAR